MYIYICINITELALTVLSLTLLLGTYCIMSRKSKSVV